MVVDTTGVEYKATQVEELLERAKHSFTPPPALISPLIKTPPQTMISPLLETPSQTKSPPKSHKKTLKQKSDPASHPAPLTPPAAPTTPIKPHRHPTPQRTATRPPPITDFVQHMELPPSTPYVDPQIARYVREIEHLKQVNRQAEQNAQRSRYDYMDVSRNAELYRQQCNYYQGSVVSGGHNNYNYNKRGR